MNDRPKRKSVLPPGLRDYQLENVSNFRFAPAQTDIPPTVVEGASVEENVEIAESSRRSTDGQRQARQHQNQAAQNEVADMVNADVPEVAVPNEEEGAPEDITLPVHEEVITEEVIAVAADTLPTREEEVVLTERAKWGELRGTELLSAVNSAYTEVARWRRNIFKLPTGKAGMDFISELTTLCTHFNNGTVFEPIALTLMMLIFPLLLQKPDARSKTADHIRYLEKRLVMWKSGNLSDLLNEGRAIQKRLCSNKKHNPPSKQDRFIKLMEEGRVSAALRCVGSQESNLLQVNEQVVSDLKSKHPEPEEAQLGSVIQGPLPRKLVEEVTFEGINEHSIYSAAKKVGGAGGPSGGDAELWKRLLCSKQFKKKPAELCTALAITARKLNTTKVKPEYLRAFVAGRLIPLDKNPGVRPIGIGEAMRRIISSATMSLLKSDLVDATAPLQTCAGIPGGIEASIHAMRRIFEDPETEAILLVDASNAFNALNRAAALHNVQYTCPELAMFVSNIYGCEAELFLANSDETILSREGTTQGGPESMGFYAASTTLLCNQQSTDTKKLFYADDGSSGGKLEGLHKWWLDLQVAGPPLGYFPRADKSWLIVKPEHAERGRQLFIDVNVTEVGHEFLGSFIGSHEGTVKFVESQITDWIKDIDALVEIAKFEPQLSYSAYVFGTSRRWQFVSRTTPNVSAPFQKLEDHIHEKLIPALFGGQPVSDDLRQICSLPARLGGLGVLVPPEESDMEYENSKIATAQLADAIFNQESRLVFDKEMHANALATVRQKKNERLAAMTEHVKAVVSESLHRLIELSSEKGASSWLTSLPLARFGFRLNKQQFQDALCLRYNLALKDVPRRCVCGADYSIEHCLSCKNGGFVIMRHNSVRDTACEILSEVCKDVNCEPALLPVTGEVLPNGCNITDGARADISALGFWTPLNRAFFDVKVINSLARSNRSKELSAMYKSHEEAKKRAYGPRILQVEKGSFTPLVMSCTGGVAPEASAFIKQLALKLSIRRQERYSELVSFLRRRL